MTKQVFEANQPQVFNLVIAGARRSDATTGNNEIVEGVVILFRGSVPVIINGEEVDVNKKWFRATSVIDALIMSIDDATAALAADVLEGNWMSLRGLTARVSVFDGDDNELHYKLEF